MSEESEPRAAQTTDQDPTDGPSSSDHATSEKDWKQMMGESYRSWTSWLSDEIENLDQLGREKLQSAMERISERFPAEERKRLRDSAEAEIYEFLGELKSLGARIRKTPQISRLEQKGNEAIRSSATKVREWAGHVEDTFSAAGSPPDDTNSNQETPSEASSDQERTSTE